MPIKPENRRLYPHDWKAIRAEVLERAGNRCERCGAPNHEWGYWEDDVFLIDMYDARAIWLVLTIAHLDQNPTNNGAPGHRPNLAALCQRCHNRHDAKARAAHAKETRRAKLAVKDLFSSESNER